MSRILGEASFFIRSAEVPAEGEVTTPTAKGGCQGDRELAAAWLFQYVNSSPSLAWVSLLPLLPASL